MHTPLPSLTHFFLFLSSFVSSPSCAPFFSFGGWRAAALRLRSLRQAVCQFRRLALKPDMSSSAQLGRQPITMLSRALPQGWKELNTCWLSSLPPCLCLSLSPQLTRFFLFHFSSLSFFFSLFSPYFLLWLSLHHLVIQVSSTSGSVYLSLDLWYSICLSFN